MPYYAGARILPLTCSCVDLLRLLRYLTCENTGGILVLIKELDVLTKNGREDAIAKPLGEEFARIAESVGLEPDCCCRNQSLHDVSLRLTQSKCPYDDLIEHASDRFCLKDTVQMTYKHIQRIPA